MNRLHSPAIFQFHYSISFEERNDSLKSITISKRSKIPIIGITIITIIVNKDVSSKRSFFIDILFAYDVAYGPRTRKRKREKGSVSFSRSGRPPEPPFSNVLSRKRSSNFPIIPANFFPGEKGKRGKIRRLKTKLFALIVSPYSGKSSSRIR